MIGGEWLETVRWDERAGKPKKCLVRMSSIVYVGKLLNQGREVGTVLRLVGDAKDGLYVSEPFAVVCKKLGINLSAEMAE